MINRDGIACILLSCLLLTSRCVSGDSSFDVIVSGHGEELSEGYRFKGEVRLGGYYSDVSVKGVTIKLLDSNNNTLEIVAVGELNTSRSQVKIDATTERQPKHVLVFVKYVVAPKRDSKKWDAVGLERTDSDDYYPFSSYDPLS